MPLEGIIVMIVRRGIEGGIPLVDVVVDDQPEMMLEAATTGVSE